LPRHEDGRRQRRRALRAGALPGGGDAVTVAATRSREAAAPSRAVGPPGPRHGEWRVPCGRDRHPALQPLSTRRLARRAVPTARAIGGPACHATRDQRRRSARRPPMTSMLCPASDGTAARWPVTACARRVNRSSSSTRRCARHPQNRGSHPLNCARTSLHDWPACRAAAIIDPNARTVRSP
jgi:hypothetical protein